MSEKNPIQPELLAAFNTIGEIEASWADDYQNIPSDELHRKAEAQRVVDETPLEITVEDYMFVQDAVWKIVDQQHGLTRFARFSYDFLYFVQRQYPDIHQSAVDKRRAETLERLPVAI